MSSPHPLNQAVVAQALHGLRNGQLRRCQAMGFSAKSLEALNHPALVSVLINATVPWCSVRVNPNVMQRLLEQVRDVEQEIGAVDLIVQLGKGESPISSESQDAPVPHPLNQAVVAQALHGLRNGQLRRCQAMGFTAEALQALKHPVSVSMLINATVPWCSVSVNPNIMQRLLEQMRGVEEEIEAIDRMLRLGASTEMVSEFYGLTHQEVALRRQVIGLPQRKGRWPVLTETQDAAIWQRWSACVRARGIGLQDDASMLALSMDLAEEHALPLSVVWSANRNWIEQGLT